MDIVRFYCWLQSYYTLLYGMRAVGEFPRKNGFFEETLSIMCNCAYEDFTPDEIHIFMDFMARNWDDIDPGVMAYWHMNKDKFSTYDDAEAFVDGLDPREEDILLN